MRLKMLRFVILLLFVSCSSGEKIQGIEVNKLRIGITSYLSIQQMYGNPHKEAQVPNNGEFYQKGCGGQKEYLIAQEYKLKNSVGDQDRVTLFYNRNKVLCHFEMKDYDL